MITKLRQPNANYSRSERGVALIATLLLLMLMSAMAVALFYKVNTEQNLQRTDSGNTLAYYGAEAAMEKMTADISLLYAQQAAPNWCAITALQNQYPQSSDVGVTYAEYRITVPTPPSGCGNPPSSVRTISQGPNEGLMAQIVPLTLQVTADRPGGEEVRMIRQVEVAEIPVFQFGMFSESDLSYFPGPDFDFNGRVHTNGNLFLASDSSVTFHTKIRAAGDVVRDKMANGASTAAQGRNGTVYVPTTSAGCDPPSRPACRNLRLSPNEGSSVGGPTPPYGGTGSPNPGWTALSTSTYNGMILSGTTGAKKLSMAFVQAGVNPIEIIRRPLPGESINSAVGQSRLYNQAQIRVLLSDDPAELPGGSSDGQNIRLANVQTNAAAPDYTNGVPVPGASNTYFAEGTTAAVSTETGWSNVPTTWPSLKPAGAPLVAANRWNLLDGYLRVEIRRSDGTYLPVTREWLELGFARGFRPPTNAAPNTVHPNAILIFQQQADRNGNGIQDPAVVKGGVVTVPAELVTDGGTGSVVRGPATRNNWYPINMYDSREGELRESQGASTTCHVGGVLNVVEIDLKNLRRWLNGTIGTNGLQTEYLSQNGYILYFSDRRGMQPNGSGVKVGEYGYEDVINPASVSGTPNGSLDIGEDVNNSGNLDTYGAADLGLGFGPGKSGDPTKSVDCMNVARKNWVSGARHAVRLVNGSLGNVPTRPDNNAGGFTLASENPGYILGEYNANSAGYGDPHASSAILADTVTLLSNNWSDIRSFSSPMDVNGRLATSTYYRVAIASGKNRNFPLPGFGGAPQDFGTDGGVHNFLRYLENWGSKDSYYRGSMASLFYSMYATGVFKCCGMVYSPPQRHYEFDLDFQDINKMPPGTPTFRDVVSLGFQRVF